MYEEVKGPAVVVSSIRSHAQNGADLSPAGRRSASGRSKREAVRLRLAPCCAQLAQQIRRASRAVQTRAIGHIGSSLSIAEILAVVVSDRAPRLDRGPGRGTEIAFVLAKATPRWPGTARS